MEQIKNDEVALSHPSLPLSVRCADDGFIYIQAGEACGAVFDSKTGAVTIYGSSVNLIAPDLRVDGIPVNKENIVQRAVGKIRNLFNQATPKFPAVKE